MTTRRTFLGKLMAAPVAAASVGQEASGMLGKLATTSIGNRESISSGALSGATREESPKMQAMRKLFFAERERMIARASAQDAQRMPTDIASMKSWSPAFKTHILAQRLDQMAEWDSMLYGGEPDKAMMKFLRKVGVL